jgi:hypothetical protein
MACFKVIPSFLDIVLTCLTHLLTLRLGDRDADRDADRLGEAVRLVGDRRRLGEADLFADRLVGDFLPAIVFLY